jgi:hypothetical protein
MKVWVRRVGTQEAPKSWPDGWALPSLGDAVTYPDSEQWRVNHIIWYPEGADDGADEQGEPYVYLILSGEEQ